MRRAHQITAAITLILAGFIARESLGLKLHTSLGPGPGFFPFWLSIALSILAVAMFCQATLTPAAPSAEGFIPSSGGALRIASIVFALVTTVALLQLIGFRLMSLVFYIFMLIILGQTGWATILLTAFVGSFGVYHVFVYYLQVPLPIGIFGI